MMSSVIKAPNRLSIEEELDFKIFLAGSIEMGSAIDWQSVFTESFEHDRVTLLNPRRDEWDSTWEQSIINQKFTEQVEWELEYLESCDMVVFYLDPNTKSPISLMELGLILGLNNENNRQKIIVCCPHGFYRKGNVDIICNKYFIDVVESLDDLIYEVKHYLSKI